MHIIISTLILSCRTFAHNTHIPSKNINFPHISGLVGIFCTKLLTNKRYKCRMKLQNITYGG